MSCSCGIIFIMKVTFLTLGCKVNQYETEAMKEIFASRGYQVVSSEDETADIYVINTCTVTNLADRKSRQFIRRAKASNPDSVVAVTGCYAQMDSEKVSEIPGVNIVAGTNEKSKLIDYIEEYIGDRMSACHVKSYEELNNYESNGIITAMDSRTRAYIKIQEGCNRFCTYCIIPYARGKVRSRDEDEIIQEARGLIESGFKEIVLTGINTALYGADQSPTEVPALRRLMDRISEIPGEYRIRLSSLEPNVVSPDDILKIVGAERLCHHLHLSIQSGSNSILEAMNRRYTREEYLGIVKALHDFDSYYGITTDIIVGFPGETEEDFVDSLELVKGAELSRVHVFPYSPRKGTKASVMDNQIPPEIKKIRAKELSILSDEVALSFHEKCIGAKMKVLFEEIKEDIMTGYTDNYMRAYAHAEGWAINKLVDVEIIKPHLDGVWVEVKNL